MKRLGLLSALALIVGAGQAWAQTSLQLVEVITSPQRTEFLQKQVDAFEAANPGITVEIVSLPWGEAFEKFLTMVQAGETPDIVEMPERWMSLYASNGQLEDLSPYIASWDEGSTLSERTLTFAKTVNDTPYMIPYGFYLRGLYWNKKIFEEAGVQPPTTIQEFVDVSNKIAALGDGKAGYCLRGGKGGFGGSAFFMLSNNGKPFFNEDGTSTLNEPGAVAGLQTLVDLYASGGAPKDSVNWGFNETVAGFYSGACAMLDNDPDAMIGILEHMNPDDFAVAPMPLGPDGKAYPSIGYAGWSIFADSEHKDESWKLVSYLSANAQNVEWAKFVGVIPIHNGAEKDPSFAVERYDGWFKELNDPAWNPIPWPAHLEEFGYFFDVMSVEGTQKALLGQETAQAIADGWAQYLTEAQQKWMAAQK
jgi:multiple sugar transport system substrate-binding protein